MNGISMNMKCACGAHHVAETAAIAISKNVFIAEPFGSDFFIQCHPERAKRVEGSTRSFNNN